ncbi:MAG: hypothetical protein QOC92_1283 [Acidimicrobiaceae bacterium]|jgi:hypothetical protein
MGQMYLQRFVYAEGVAKVELDQAWAEAFKAFARSGNWGDVEKGVTHYQSYGTGWGGYALLEVEDPEAFGRYQMFHNQTYGHVVHVTLEPLWDMDRAFEPTIRELK